MEERVEWSNNEGKWGCKYICQGVSAIGYSYKKEQAYKNAITKWKYRLKKKEEENERKG